MHLPRKNTSIIKNRFIYGINAIKSLLEARLNKRSRNNKADEII